MEEEIIIEVQKRSEEIQDIIDRMPTGWTRYVTVLVMVLMVAVLVLGYLIKYPDTVIGEVKITSEQAPVRLLAAGTGRLHLLRQNRDSVEADDIIAYIDDGAVLKDVMSLDSMLFDRKSTAIQYPPVLLLGSLSTTYDTWAAAWHNLNQLLTTDSYSNMRKSLDIQMDASIALAESQHRQLHMSAGQLRISQLRQGKDSILHEEGAISDEEMERKRNTLVSQEIQLIGQETTLLNTKSSINQNRIERARIDNNEAEELRRAMDHLAVREIELRSALREWKERHLVIASVRGRLEYLGFWRENEYVLAGQVLFSVLPPKGLVFGEAHITASGFGKVKVGQAANVKLENFPYDEFGHVAGRVKDISHLTQTLQTSQGVAETYLVIITFPKGMITNYGQLLDVDYEARGQVEIITKPKRIIQRLFDNLKSWKEK